MSAEIRIEGVGKQWAARGRGDRIVALETVNLSVEAGSFVVLLGPSGCGKSTLLRMIAGLETPSMGAVLVGRKRVLGPGSERGMIFQDYALFAWRTVLANVTFGLEARGVRETERLHVANELIELVGLQGYADLYPSQLSGGMQQRVALARALAPDPEVLLMDEPFSAVDSQTRELLQDELLRIWNVRHKTILFVTHDIAEAVYLADRVVTFSPRPGRVISDLQINLARPRDRTHPKFIDFVRELRTQLSHRFEPRLRAIV